MSSGPQIKPLLLKFAATLCIFLIPQLGHAQYVPYTQDELEYFTIQLERGHCVVIVPERFYANELNRIKAIEAELELVEAALLAFGSDPNARAQLKERKLQLEIELMRARMALSFRRALLELITKPCEGPGSLDDIDNFS